MQFMEQVDIPLRSVNICILFRRGMKKYMLNIDLDQTHVREGVLLKNTDALRLAHPCQISTSPRLSIENPIQFSLTLIVHFTECQNKIFSFIHF